MAAVLYTRINHAEAAPKVGTRIGAAGRLGYIVNTDIVIRSVIDSEFETKHQQPFFILGASGLSCRIRSSETALSQVSPPLYASAISLTPIFALIIWEPTSASSSSKHLLRCYSATQRLDEDGSVLFRLQVSRNTALIEYWSILILHG